MDGTYEATPGKTIGIYAGILVSHGVINTFGVRLLGILNYCSIILHSAGVFSLAVAVLAKAPKLQPGSFVFGKVGCCVPSGRMAADHRENEFVVL